MVVIALLAAFDHENPHNKVKLNNHHDITTNITLQYIPTKKDLDLWDHMEKKTIDWIKIMAKEKELEVEYWQTR